MTRHAILAVARAQFADQGYDRTTMRSVAAAAGVNPALIHHHFGSKDQLFLGALSLPINPVEVISQLLAAGPRSEFPDRLVRYFITAWRDPITGQALQAALRRAVSDNDSAALIRNLADSVLLPRIATALGVPKLRVATAMSHLIGLVLGATILRVQPLALATDEELTDLVTPAIRRYLT